MDDLFKKANKYSILEDDVYAATQQILVTNRLAKNDLAENFKTTSQHRQTGKRQDRPQQSNQATLTPLSISYEKLFPMIRELSNFRWPEPIKTDSAKRDQSRKCAYHKEHGHTTKQCRSFHYLVEKLIRVRHLKQYICLKERCGQTSKPLQLQQLLESWSTTSMKGPLMKNTTLNEKGKGCFRPPPYKSRLTPSNPDWLMGTCAQ